MKQSDSGFDKFTSCVDVSRETLDALTIYHDLLVKWQRKINLVSPTTLPNAWERHFLDSAQLFRLLSTKDKSIFDLGSGAGFPGLVLSVMGASRISLIESDQRKSAFLSEVIRQTQSTAKVITQRIESFAPTEKAAIITSRACAPLHVLFGYAYPLLQEQGECLFLKGRGAAQEIEDARREWMFHVEQTPSMTDAEGCILRIRDLRRIG